MSVAVLLNDRRHSYNVQKHTNVLAKLKIQSSPNN